MRQLISFLLLACALSANAQQPVGTWSVIPKAGVSVANISGAEIYYGLASEMSKVKGKYNARFVGGVEAEWQALPTTSFSLGVLYAQQGCRYSDFKDNNGTFERSDFIGFSRMREKLDYLCLPLMVNQYVAPGLAVKVGVQPSFLCKSEVTITTSKFEHQADGSVNVGKSQRSVTDTKDMRHKMDVAIPVGVSYEYLNVLLDVRYQLGLLKLYKDDQLPSEKNRAFYITVGYKFNL